VANAYFEPGDQRAAKVADLFAKVARRYDLINDLQSFGLHRRWKARVLQLSGAAPGQRALDLCCGTGDLAFGLARRGAEVIGLDFSDAMLSVARERRQRARTQFPPRAKVGLIRGDALHLPFPDGTFDVVTVGYGLRNLTRWETGLQEMRRVARPGGRLLVLEFGKPDDRVWRALYFGYLRLFVPVLGRLVCGDAQAYAYILESLQHYPAQHGVAEKMRELGLNQVRLYPLLGGIMSINYGEKPA